MQRDFLRPSIERLTTDIQTVAAGFIDRLAELAPECDFVNEVANWYLLRVIMTLLGVPREDEAHLLMLTQRIFGSQDPDILKEAAGPKSAPEAFQAFCDYFRPLLHDRRAQPRDDLASKIANGRIGGELMSEHEALSYYVTMATAGHDTTSASIAGGLLALLQNPAEMAKLRAMPEVTYGVVDEMIRWVAPVKHFFRTATEDYVLRGQTIKAGDAVMLSFYSGCRDEEVFDDPTVFRVDRQPNDHLAMGFGPHVCLGQHLARLEIKIFFQHFLSRVEQMALAGEPARVDATFIAGFKRVPIRYRMRTD